MKSRTSPFETHAVDYDQWFDSARGAQIFSLELGCLRQSVGKVSGRWLEVGVGSGRFANALGIQVGVDPSQKMVDLSSERGIETYLAFGEQLPFGDFSFEGVLLVCTICFLNDPKKTLEECRRVLKDSGHLIIGFVPINSPWGIYHFWQGKRGHLFYSRAHFYTSEDIKTSAENIGFKYENEYGCILPIPDESLIHDDVNGQTLREESFVVLSFSKKDNDRNLL